MQTTWTVGILLFKEAEVLDFAGPFEVFSTTEACGTRPFYVITVAQEKNMIRARNVCTGVFLLGRCGLLDGKKAVTHWMDADRLEKEYAISR